MKLIFLLFLFFVSCSDANLPLLPDIDTSVDDADISIFDNEIKDMEPAEDADVYEIETTLIVGTVKGYDVPYSGEVFYSLEENISKLKKIDHSGFGSSSGSDIEISTWDEGFMVISRHDSTEINIFRLKDDGEFETTQFIDESGEYLNFHDGVYNHIKNEFLFSANAKDTLFAYKEGKVRNIKISENENISPSKMKVIGNTLFVTLQNMNDKFISTRGEISVVSLNDYSFMTVDLSVKNPSGKIEYNPAFDRKHIYIACAGSWQKRDGALVRVNIETFQREEVLEESSETGSILNGDFVDVSIADNGLIYIVFSDNSERWINKLLEFDTKSGTIKEVDSGINAFAATPVDYSPLTGKVYYFADIKHETYLRSFDTVDKNIEEQLLEQAPASLRIWKR
jgi:hypothetical protein